MKNIFLCIFLLLLSTGCEQYLDTENLTKKDSSNFPKTEADIQSALISIYHELRKTTDGEEGQCFFITSELLSDDRFGGGGANDRRLAAVDLLLKSDENMFADPWRQNYRGIYRANFLIEQLAGMKVSDDIKKQARGEASFLRAYFYFQLCQMFGTVPLVISTKVENLPRAKQEDLYAQIGTDLINAIECLPAIPYSPSDASMLGRANHWDAEGMLARVFLYYTGYYGKKSMPLIDGTLTKEEVIKYIDDCVENSGYGLVPDFHSLWPYTNEYTAKDYPFVKERNMHWVGESGNNLESMFVIKHSTQTSWNDGTSYRANRICLFFTPREGTDMMSNFPYGLGWGAGPVNSKTYTDWPVGDLRRDGSIMNVSKEMPNYVWGNDRQMNETGYWSKKYASFNCIDENGKSINFYMKLYPSLDPDYQINNMQDIYVLRFADVLLMQAELKQDAVPLNHVRHRAGLADVAYSDENLRNERHWELAFEGLRYWDLLRWHIAGDVLEANQNNVKVKNNLVDEKMDFTGIKERIQATKGVLPLPKTQIDLSNGVLLQNPGWGTESLKP